MTIVRKPWSHKETEILIRIWEDVGSITLLSIILKRSTSSVQTQASRVGLPRRVETLERHRRRWTEGEEHDLRALTKQQIKNPGQINIFELAKTLNRSVDAVTAKLVEMMGQEEIIDKIFVPEEIRCKMDIKTASLKIKSYRLQGEVQDTRYQAKQRICLSCQSPFWSSGAHNRICDKCSAGNDGTDGYSAW